MHSLLQQMGEEIVYGQSAEPGKRQFLTKATEISEIFEENTGTGTVLGIKLRELEGEEIQMSESAFQGMNHLQFLDVDCILCLPEGLNCLPDKLRLLDWKQCPLRFWPSKFSGKFLVELIMPNNKFEKLWEGIKPLPCLKRMDLSYSDYLKEIPDLSKATSIEILKLHDCRSLLELPFSIGRLINLEELYLSFCGSLEKIGGCSSLEKLSDCSSLKELDLSYSGIGALELPLSVRTWSSFYRLDMSGLSDLQKFPNVPYSIVELDLSNTGIEEIPPCIENLYCLEKLKMMGCRKLEIVSPNISKLEKLKTIALCKNGAEALGVDGLFKATIDGFDKWCHQWLLISDLNIHYILPRCLTEKVLTPPFSSLRLIGPELNTIPDCIRRLSGLGQLDISACPKLTALPPLPASLEALNACGCAYLESIDSSFKNPIRNFADCYNLNQKARKLIQTSACEYALLPGEEVPAHFTHQAISSSLTIDLTPRHLPSSFRFKACILLSRLLGSLNVSCCVRGKQTGLTLPYGSTQLRYMSDLYSPRNHLYIFEDSVSLSQDFPEAKDATFSELSFLFTVRDDESSLVVVKGCGVRILEANNENADNDDDDEGGNDSKSADDDDDDTDDVDEDIEDDIDDNDAGFSDSVI